MAPKSVLVTGCSAGGIGSALVESFQKKGFHVFATARTTSKMQPLAALDNVTLLQLDVTSRESIEHAVEVVKKQTGGTLDVLVNNSGAGYGVPVLDADLQTVRDMFEVNFFGTVLATQLFAPLVIAAKGSIVNICSTAAHAHPLWMGESLSLASSVLVDGLSLANSYARTRNVLGLQGSPGDLQRNPPSRDEDFWRQSSQRRGRRSKDQCCSEQRQLSAEGGLVLRGHR